MRVEREIGDHLSRFKLNGIIYQEATPPPPDTDKASCLWGHAGRSWRAIAKLFMAAVNTHLDE